MRTSRALALWSSSIVLALAASATAQTTLPKMDLVSAARDGNAADVTGPPAAGSDADEKRMFGGGGRRVASWRVDNRVRAFFEEDFNNPLPLGQQAVEVDVQDPPTAGDRLFILTKRVKETTETGSTLHPATIRQYRIQNQTAPFHLDDLELEPTVHPTGMRVIPGSDELIVWLDPDPDGHDGPVKASELRIYDYSSGIINPVWKDSVTLPIGASMICGAPHTFAGIRDVQVAHVGAPGLEERMAIVSATIEGGCVVKPQPLGLLVANIQNSQAIFFYDTNLDTQTWDPCRTGPCKEWGGGGFCYVRDPNPGGPAPRDLVYVVGAEAVGLRELEITEVSNPLIGIVQSSPASGGWALNPADYLAAVVADPADPQYLYVIGIQRAYSVDRTMLGMPGFFEEAPGSFIGGPAGDVHLMLADPTGMGPVEREAWTLTNKSAGHILKVTDFSQSGIVLDPPDTGEGHYYAGPTDGAAADFASNSVYASTFGGVGRWDISGVEPLPLASVPPGASCAPSASGQPCSYQPALDLATGFQHNTEDLLLYDFGTTANPEPVLLAPCAQGNFFAWPIDPISHDILPGSVYRPDPSTYPASFDWPWPSGTYGNDLVVAPHPTKPEHFVFVDYSNNATHEIAIGGYRWGDPSGEWIIPTLVWHDPKWDEVPPNPDPKITPNVRALATDAKDWAPGGGSPFLIAGANNGFLVVRLLPFPMVEDHVYTTGDNVDGITFSKVMGVAIHSATTAPGTARIFVSLGDTGNMGTGEPDQRFAIASYALDKSTGKVIDPATGLETDSPIQVLFDGQEIYPPVPPPTGPVYKPDDFPGIFVSSGEQLSLVRLPGTTKVRLYSGSESGHATEIEWDAATDTMTPLSYWHNGGYFEPVMEVTPYLTIESTPAGFGPTLGPGLEYTLRLLVTKRSETFEIVKPPYQQ